MSSPPAWSPGDLNARDDDVAHYMRLAVRGIPGMLLGAWLGASLALTYLLVYPPVYLATATVTVNAITSAPFDPGRSASGLVDPPTEAAIASSDKVARLAIARYRPLTTDPDTLRSSIEAEPVEDSTIMRITSSAEDVQQARAQADAVANAYLAYRAQEAEARRDAIVDELASTMQRVTEERSAARAQVGATAPDSQARAQALVALQSADSQLEALQARRNELAGIDTSGGVLLNSANASPAYLSPSRPSVVASGTLGGALLGFLVSLLVSRWRGRIRRVSDLATMPGFVAAVEVPARKGPGPGPTVPQVDDNLRALRERLKQCRAPEASGGVVAVFEARPGPNLDDVALGLGAALSQDRGALLVVVGVPPEGHPKLTSQDSLQGGPDGRLRVNGHGSLRVAVCHVSDSPTEYDSWFTEQASRAVQAAHSTGQTVVVWCADEPSEATRLRILSESDSLVLVATQGRTSLSVMRRWAGEADFSGVRCLAAVVITSRRRRGP